MAFSLPRRFGLRLRSFPKATATFGGHCIDDDNYSVGMGPPRKTLRMVTTTMFTCNIPQAFPHPYSVREKIETPIREDSVHLCKLQQPPLHVAISDPIKRIAK